MAAIPALSPEPPATLGDEIEVLLNQLSRAGLKIGPRERIAAAALTASLVTAGAAETLDDLKPMLAPLVARSPEERRIFLQTVEAGAPTSGDGGAGGSKRGPRPEARPWLPVLGLAILIVAAGLLFWWFQPPPYEEQRQDDLKKPSLPTTPSAFEKIATPARPAGIESLERIAKAAERFDGAPTIEELAEALATERSDKKIDWPAESYAIRLHEFSGLPRYQPLPLFAGQGLVWARLGLALEGIEHPGLGPTLAELASAAQQTLKERQPGAVYKIADELPGWLGRTPPESKAELIALVQRRGRDEQPSPADAADEFTIQRALAIAPLAPDARLRATFADAPWRPRRLPNANRAPAWVPWVAALVPLGLGLIWLARSLALRKAFLRRRPPKVPPLHVDLVAQAATRVPYSAGLFRQIAQRLERRTPRPTREIDAEATIAATIAAGGEIITPIYRAARHTPEYLVLIERRSAGDHDALRLRDLVARVHSLVPIVAFYFNGEPSVLEPDRGGQAVPLERLQGQYGDDRLIILGSGAELLDPATLLPHASTSKLRHWPKRALLTPLPLAEWGRQEFALAHELAMPIGRATPEGMLTLAEMLGLDGAERQDLLSQSGDGLARPLPEILRIRPQRFLYGTPPADVTEPQLIQSLRNYLDGPAFEWLCALAVYPAVQWDLTLFLGISMREQMDDSAGGKPIYREDRVAAITQLPWLRQGHMPNWVRRALIGELRPGRAAEIRRVLNVLLSSAELKGDGPGEEAIRLRIAREAAKERLAPEELFEDEVLLDFLARGHIEDLALPRLASWLEQIMPRRWLDRLGIPEFTAGVVAVIYAVSAAWLAPKPSDGALLSGAWLPLAALAAGVIFALIVANPNGAYQVARSALVRMTTPAFAFALLTISYDPLRLVVPSSPAGDALMLVVAAVAWLAADRIRDRLGIPRRRPQSGLVRTILAAGEVLAVVVLASLAADYLKAFDSGNWPLVPAITAAVLFTGGWIAARVLPSRLRRPRPAPRRSRSLWSLAGGGLRAALALLPILPAVLLNEHVAASSELVEALPGGATAIAETPDHAYLAVGGMDGFVRVFEQREREHELLWRIRVDEAPVTGLALRPERDDQPANQIVLAAGSGDGAIRLYSVRNGSQLPLPQTFAGLESARLPARVALGPGAALFAAIEMNDGVSKLVTAGGELSLPEGGPVTAIAAAGSGQFVVATLDGRLRVLSAPADGPPRFAEDGEDLGRLPGGARILKIDEQTGSLLATGDDGSVLHGRLMGGQLVSSRAAPDRLDQLARGRARGLGLPIDVSRLAPDQERALKPKDTFKECSNCPQMTVVPAGSFIMGSPASEARHSSGEAPQHTVTITRQFAVGQFELTFDEWDACVADGGCNGYKPFDEGWGRDRRPVINVSWNDARGYVAWLSNKTGRTYRLLTEAEYEYAARAGTQTVYPWGNDIGRGNANCFRCGSQWDRKQTAPVGSFPANFFGLYDMVGNVYAWTEDCNHDSYNGAPADGSAWTSGNCGNRVVRGGSWDGDPENLRSAFRSWIATDGRFNGLGLRVGRTLLPP
jgi:formylglycine-generating enzyme required for sulfatase activity